jgi:hypothetical protein
MAAWGAACAMAVGVYAQRPASFSITGRGYWSFLLVPWKVVTFGIATIAMTVVAPYTGDPTWDYVDALFMSVLCFLGAPWVVGTLYLAVRGRARATSVYVAICLWMFSASWSYDLYILLRDGVYPNTWLPNIFASSVLYISAGLLWSLDWRAGRGATFSFLEPDWPNVPPTAAFGKVLWYALPFMVIAAASILYFILPN